VPLLEEVWRATHVYFGDERGVGPEHADSNYRMVREAWLDRMPIPAEQVHRIRGELPLEEAAADYRTSIAALLDGRGDSGARTGFDLGARPGFDLVVLGLGTDGHTASLIPGVSLDFVAEPWVGVGPAPLSPARVRRVTLTAAALRRTDRCVFWVKGENKAEVVRAAVAGEGMATTVPDVVPATGQVTWLLDRGAASRIWTPQ
jgi:6-phosphogluconolactonase